MRIGRIVLIKRPQNVGRWLNPVIDLEARAAGGTAREGSIQIPSLLAQRIANARRNRAKYYYSTILATSKRLLAAIEIEAKTWNGQRPIRANPSSSRCTPSLSY